FYVWRIVRLQHPQSWIAAFALLATLFWPTPVVNSAVWGQTDMLYAAPLLASLFYVLADKQRAAWIAFAIAFSVKLQAVFFAPVLLALMLRKETPWTYSLYVPLVYALMVIPMWLAGRPMADLLTIYAVQMTEYTRLTLGA